MSKQAEFSETDELSSENSMRGRITSVRGTVLDAWFAGELPPIDAALVCEMDGHRSVTAVVHSHLGNSSVRAIATSSTRGMCRGAQDNG